MIKFFYANVKSGIVEQSKKLRKFIPEIFIQEQKAFNSLNYIFCTDEYLLEINKQFLKHSNYTDILTFDLSVSSAIIGEIYISVNRVLENAKNYNVAFQNEVQRVIFHGALHLCGYLDKKKSEIALMRQKEDFYLLEYSKFTK